MQNRILTGAIPVKIRYKHPADKSKLAGYLIRRHAMSRNHLLLVVV